MRELEGRMDETRFNEAKQAYADGDYHAAARGFLVSAGEEIQGCGMAFHMAGNALMRLGRYEDAVTAYEHALEDESYDRISAAAGNLGAAYRTTGRFGEALEAYDLALRAPDCRSSYKAYQGKAGALYEMGRLGDAAAAYRSAALEGDNPDSGRALNNLGLCYMAMGRLPDAVETYRAAVGMDGYGGKGKASANLGLALTLLKRHGEALKAFDSAVDEYSYELTDRFQKAYQVSMDALPSSVEDEIPVGSQEDVFADIEEHDTDFFTRTDAEMRELDKAARREEGRFLGAGRTIWLRIGLVVLVTVVLAVVLVWAWMSGYGYPSHLSTVESLLEAHGSGESVEQYWIAVPSADIGQEMDKLPPNYVDYQVDAVDADATTSRVDVTIQLDGGAPLRYEFILAREGVGWKVTGVENDWRSTGGS